MANLHKSKPDSEDLRRRRSCCQRHPKHRQSPGVCSLCLAEKLSQIHSPAAAARKASDSLSSSSYSSASCSSCSSPNRFDSEANLKFSMFFKKSRSVAVAPRLMSECGEKIGRLGFWSRFLSRPRRKITNMDQFMHSSTVLVHTNVHA